jgi:hypothetical protein
VIKLHIFLNESERAEFESVDTKSFNIISHSEHAISKSVFYFIETTEEEATFLTLKYGSDKIWRR